MKNFIKTFSSAVRENEVGGYIAAVAALATFGFAIVAFGSVLNGGEFKMFPVFTLPLVFWALAAAHFIARPLVRAHYSKV